MGRGRRLVRRLARRLLGGLTPPHDDRSVVQTSTSLEPFTTARMLDRDALAAAERRLHDVGVRLHPYPFASSVAIASDIDNSEREDFEGYTDLLVRRLGLDFGDSFRLFGRAKRQPEALSLFRFDGAPPPFSEHDRHPGSLGFVELLRQIHLGNVDHLHGLDALGGRVVWLRAVRLEDDGTWIAPIPELQRSNTPPFNFRSDFVPTLRVAVRSDANLPGTATVRLEVAGDDPRALTLRRIAPDDDAVPVLGGPGGCVTWFGVDRAPTWPLPPTVDELTRVVLEPGPPDASTITVDALIIVNFSRSMVREAATLLGERFGVSLNLLTDHASKVFVNTGSETRHGGRNADRVRETPLPALYGRALEGPFAYSALGDDPASICYVLPELRERCGLRFVNPGGRSGEAAAGFELLATVVPTPVRDESSVYLARRCKLELPKDADVPERWRNDMGTRTFAERLRSVLDGLVRHPGRAWPVYTHLGNLNPKEERTSPYFAGSPFLRLQDHVYGISGKVAGGHRAWFTRASVLYDYALMTRSIAPHVTREGEDVVRITSWHDETLGQRLPLSPAQLHGLTFYVSDSRAAEVTLDGEPLAELTRNAADETGRPSVTIVGAGIRHAVADAIDPITVGPGGETRVPLEPADLDPVGGQLLAWTERISGPAARVGLLVETAGGGVFHFGDAELAPTGCDATYALPPAPPGAWRRRVAPFYAMTWRAGAAPGGPLPSHPVERVTLIARGEPGDRVEVDRVEMLRPSTVDTAAATGRCVVGGFVRGGAPETGLTLTYEDAHGTTIVRDDPIVDAGGFFVFTAVPVGVTAEVATGTTSATGAPRRPSRGARLTVRGHDMSIVIP